MLKNYFIISALNLVKHRSYTVFNFVGLAFGICTCIVIFLITDYKLSFDSFNKDNDRIYRVQSPVENSAAGSEISNTATADMAAFMEHTRSCRKKHVSLFK